MDLFNWIVGLSLLSWIIGMIYLGSLVGQRLRKERLRLEGRTKLIKHLERKY